MSQTGSNRPNPTPTEPDESARAARGWWDHEAAAYSADHGGFLGDDTPDSRLIWGPEGLAESEAQLLGDVLGRRVLEVGAGAAQGSRWLAGRGAVPFALDVSSRMLAQMLPDRRVARVAGDASRLPVAANSMDLAFSAYGAIQFVADIGSLMSEVARVVRPGGRWVFSLTHPIRWAFLDEPGPEGLVVAASYFDRTPYVERDTHGAMTYAEHHRTLSDLVRAVVTAGFTIVDLVEPEWSIEHDDTWGGWSPLRGFVIPGTVIFVCEVRL